MNQYDIFGASARQLQMTDAIELSAQSLVAYGTTYLIPGCWWRAAVLRLNTTLDLRQLPNTAQSATHCNTGQ